MGISKGHTFTDGETVTAAKLNNLVDNATITSGTVTEAMIVNGAVTADKLGTNAVTGASIAANTINVSSLSNATGGGPGTLVQSGAGGVFEEFTPGTSGTFLKSAGTDAALEWGRVDSDGVADTMISGHTVLSSPGADDEVLVKEKSGINKRAEIQNLFKVVSGLTAMPSTDVVSTDEFLIIDGGFPRKITKSELASALSLSVSPAEFYHIDTSNMFGSGNDVKNGCSTAPFILRGFSSDVTQRPATSINTEHIVPAQNGPYTTGVQMPFNGEVVKIVTIMEDGGGVGGTFSVVNVNSAGTYASNTALVSATIPTTDGFNVTTYTSGNSFSAGDYLSYWAKCGDDGGDGGTNLHTLIVFKFTL